LVYFRERETERREREKREEKAEEKSGKGIQKKAIFVLEHTSLRYGGKARKEENTSIHNA
jgi:hypothetical protein